MENSNLKTAPGSTKYWYLPLITGIIFILVGIWVFTTPLASYVALSMLFAFTFLLSGVIETVYAISRRKELDNWGWSLASGMIDLIIGILLVSRPDISIAILPFFVGFAVLFRAIMSIGWSIELKRQKIKGWGNLLGIGILGLVLAFILLWNPLLGGLTIVFYTAISFITIGVFQIYLSFRLKKWRSGKSG